MLSTNTSSWTIWTSEYDRGIDCAGGHIVRFCRRIDHMINCLHAEIERHKLANRTEPCHRSANSDACETCFGDWGVYYATPAPLLEQASGAFVSTLVLADFLPDEENVLVTLHLFVDCARNRISNNNLLSRKCTRRQKRSERPRCSGQHHTQCDC